MLHSYRNQSIDLHCKSIDWFLYECNIGQIWVIWTEELVQFKNLLSHLYSPVQRGALQDIKEIKQESATSYSPNTKISEFQTEYDHNFQRPEEVILKP